MNKNFPNSALVIVDNKLLLSHTLNFLYKFNFKNIVLVKNKNFKLNLNLLKKHNFKFIIRNFQTKKFSYKLLGKKYFLDSFGQDFLLLKTSKFVNLNLFGLYKIFLNNINKLVITAVNKNRSFHNSEIFFIRRKFFLNYDFSFKKIFKNKSYKINYVNCEYIEAKKKINKIKVDNFFSKIYSKAVILDRDGVININKGYVGFKKDFKFQKGAIKAIQYLNNNNYNIFVVSNQSGIARGYFLNEDVQKLHKYMRNILTKNQSFINKIYYSPYHKDGIIKKYTKNSSCRKPGIKLFNILCKEWGINDKRNIIMIGDQKTDIEFANKAKIKSALFKSENLFSFIKKLSLSKKL